MQTGHVIYVNKLNNLTTVDKIRMDNQIEKKNTSYLEKNKLTANTTSKQDQGAGRG